MPLGATLGVLGLFIAAGVAISELKKWILPGNEELLRRKLVQLGIRKEAAQKGYLDQITATELRKQVEEYEERGLPEKGINNLLEALAMEGGRFGSKGTDKFVDVPDSPLSQAMQGRGQRGNRQDTEGVTQALQSLTEKTKMAGHVPAITRMTGPPTHG